MTSILINAGIFIIFITLWIISLKLFSDYLDRRYEKKDKELYEKILKEMEQRDKEFERQLEELKNESDIDIDIDIRPEDMC